MKPLPSQHFLHRDERPFRLSSRCACTVAALATRFNHRLFKDRHLAERLADLERIPRVECAKKVDLVTAGFLNRLPDLTPVQSPSLVVALHAEHVPDAPGTQCGEHVLEVVEPSKVQKFVEVDTRSDWHVSIARSFGHTQADLVNHALDESHQQCAMTGDHVGLWNSNVQKRRLTKDLLEVDRVTKAVQSERRLTSCERLERCGQTGHGSDNSVFGEFDERAQFCRHVRVVFDIRLERGRTTVQPLENLVESDTMFEFAIHDESGQESAFLISVVAILALGEWHKNRGDLERLIENLATDKQIQRS